MTMIVDTGFRFTKAQLGKKQIIFTSTIARAPADIFQANFPGAGTLGAADLISLAGESYIIGEGASSNASFPQTIMNRSRLLSIETRLLVLSALLRLAPSEKEIKKLILTIPDEWSADRAEFADHISGTYKFKYGRNNKSVTLKIIKPQVLPQSLGAYANQVYHFAKEGFGPRNKAIQEGPALVCDIGHGNLNLARYGPGGRYHNANPAPISPLLGVHNLIRLVQAVLQAQHNAPFSEAAIIRALRSPGRQIKIAGKPHDLNKIMAASLRTQTAAIVDQLRQQFGTGRDADHLLITSGGAHIFGKGIQEMYMHPNTIISNDSSSLDVANGLALWAHGRGQ